MQRNVHYFEKPGKENTAECLEVVKEAVKAGLSKHIVVASTAGDTGLLFSEAFAGKTTFKGRCVPSVLTISAWIPVLAVPKRHSGHYVPDRLH